jgi:hypothetical protein
MLRTVPAGIPDDVFTASCVDWDEAETPELQAANSPARATDAAITEARER